MARKLTIQEMQHIAKARGGRCLSPNIKNGRWCPKCGAKRAWTKRIKPSIDKRTATKNTRYNNQECSNFGSRGCITEKYLSK